MSLIGRTKPTTRRVRAAVTIGSSAVIATAGALAYTAGVANAAPSVTIPYYCGTAGSGHTETNDTSINFGASQFAKQPPGCYDINIVNVATTDTYGGALYYSGYYHLCVRGYQSLSAGNQNPNTNTHAVPCTSVNTGTEFIILSGNHPDDTVHLNF